MSADLQPFLISEFKTGIHSYLQPWIRPADAFEPLTNAYIYSGTVNKRAGYTPFGNQLPDHNPVMGIMKYVDYSSGSSVLVVASTVNLYYYDPGTGNYILVGTHPTFTGNITNFFNWTNWQPLSGNTSYIWMVNNKDAVTSYDGTNANQPTITINAALPTATTITTALDVKVYKQRLLLIGPTLSVGGVQRQSIYWSKQQNPAAWRVDIAGEGGSLDAPTGDEIVAAEFLRDWLVVFFTNSTWIFRYTGDAAAPFRWDKISSAKSTNAPYGSVPYDERCTSIGNTGLIACDGVNVQRYDISILDYYQTNFTERYYNQSFSQRYDNLNQSWTLYVSTENKFPLVGGVAPGSDSALIYNFLENTWATYTWTIPMTCLGIFYNQTGDTWASLIQQWQDTDRPWDWYGGQKDAPILLAGDTTGHVYRMDNSNTVTDNGTPIEIDIVTTRWNPVMQLGQKVQFAYIDIYYYNSSVNGNSPISVTLNFYVDNSDLIAASRTLTLDGPTQSEYSFKRIYVNLIGEFIQMEIDPDENSYMQFVGFILWCRPAGRLQRP